MTGQQNPPDAYTPSGAHIGGRLNWLSRTLSRDIDRVTSAHDLPVDHWYALDLIVRNDGLAMNDLAVSLAIPAPTVTKIVDRLATNAYAFRLVDHNDRRRILVHASRRGAALHQALTDEVAAAEDAFLSSLSVGSRQSITQFLSELGEAPTR